MDIVKEKNETESTLKMGEMLTSTVHVAIVENIDDCVPELMLSSNAESDLLSSPQVRALAGPMTPAKAVDFCRKVTPRRSKKDFKYVQNEQLRKTRLKDAHKGLESIARVHCEAEEIQWREKWFLNGEDEFINLQSDAGLITLERHLEDRRFEDAHATGASDELNDTLDMLTSQVSF